MRLFAKIAANEAFTKMNAANISTSVASGMMRKASTDSLGSMRVSPPVQEPSAQLAAVVKKTKPSDNPLKVLKALLKWRGSNPPREAKISSESQSLSLSSRSFSEESILSELKGAASSSKLFGTLIEHFDVLFDVQISSREIV